MGWHEGEVKKVKILGPDGSLASNETINDTTVLRVSQYNRNAYLSSLSVGGIAAETGYMLVDLSSGGAWPHPASQDHIHIQAVHVQFNATTAYVGDVEIGFLSNVDASNGDFKKLFTWHYERNVSTETNDSYYISTHFEEDDWIGITEANDTTWQTDVNILGPDGNSYPSGDGDVVLKVGRTGGTLDISVAVEYTTEA